MSINSQINMTNKFNQYLEVKAVEFCKSDKKLHSLNKQLVKFEN